MSMQIKGGTMKVIDPQELRKVQGGAACNCICSSGSAFAKQAGENASVCGCYCTGNNEANYDSANEFVPEQ
jgi:hypothetical protein